MNVALRRCRECGKTAKTVGELKDFVYSKTGFMNKANWCKACRNAYARVYMRKGSREYLVGATFCIPNSVQREWAFSE